MHASEQKPTIFDQSENERLNRRVPEPRRTEAVEPEWSSAGSDRVLRSERSWTGAAEDSMGRGLERAEDWSDHRP